MTGHANSVIGHGTKTRVGQAVVSTGLQLLLNDNVCRPAETTGFADHKISTIRPLNRLPCKRITSRKRRDLTTKAN